MVYQLTYELRTPDKDYSELYAFLEKGLGGEAIHVLRDCWWIFTTETSASKLCDEIRAHLGEKDLFFVSRLPDGGDYMNGWQPQSSWAWFQAHKD